MPSTNPTGTNPMYYLLAYADDTNAVIETDETNNCAASTTRVTVTQ
jgi:hypothetical protein